MIYEDVAPSPAFAPYIERFWAFSLEAHDPSSLDHGYADQPHLSRDVKAVFNMSPQLLTTYLRGGPVAP